ncbi:MAG: hypothetical protein LAT62_04575 [Natronospirillum sp.]|uniref:hypothetical protein n=1 Tax=Natronospirillum sp. TaxID=2812955 RepID=UPI0025D29305|nr:hypothetical protein [Natronospirillum sp.]MCH8551189.1 hypothetical protein [Natronospirillum sp.]
MPFATAPLPSQLDMDDLPMLPPKRRLSANAWQMVWTLQMMNPLRSPHTLEKFVKQFDDHKRTFGARPRTSTRLCLSVTAESMDDTDMAAEVFVVIRALEEQFGPVSQIENRSAEHWPLYQDENPRN